MIAISRKKLKMRVSNVSTIQEILVMSNHFLNLAVEALNEKQDKKFSVFGNRVDTNR